MKRVPVARSPGHQRQKTAQQPSAAPRAAVFPSRAAATTAPARTSPAAIRSSGVSGRTRVPNPTTIPPRNHGKKRLVRGQQLCRILRCGVAIGLEQNQQRQSGEESDQSFGEHHGRVIRRKRAERRKPQAGQRHAPTGELPGPAARQSAPPGSRWPGRRPPARASPRARTCLRSVKMAARNAGYPGTRMSTGVRLPPIGKP